MVMQIQFLLLERFSNLCLANCLEPLRAANEFAGRAVYRWEFLSQEGEEVHSSSGLPVLTKPIAHRAAACERLFILASYQYLEHDTAAVRRQLWQVCKQAKMVIGLDTAPWLLASAGLLDQKAATIHWDVFDAFGERFLAVRPARRHWVQDGNVITCAGAHVSYELMRHLIAKDLGSQMIIDMDHLFLRNSPEAHFGPRYHDLATPLVQRALALMHQHIAQPLPLTQIARRLACPLKTMTRRFEDELGLSPGRAYRHLRLTRARQLLTNTPQSISEIALQCGYENASAMTRAFKGRFGVTPRAVRRVPRLGIDLVQNHKS